MDYNIITFEKLQLQLAFDVIMLLSKLSKIVIILFTFFFFSYGAARYETKLKIK